MKLSPLAQIKLAAVLTAAYALLGCESPPSTAGEQAPPLYPVVSASPQGQLVTITEAAEPPATPPSAELLPSAESGVAVPPPDVGKPATVPVKLSEQLQEVVKLAQSGVGDDVILAYVQNSPVPFNPTPEEILYLTDLGVSDVVVTALVNHHGIQAPVMAQAAPPAFNGPTLQPGQPGPPPEATYNPEPQVAYGTPPPVQYVSPPPTVEYSYFYDSLAPYGAWVEVADYGWCWQPTVAVHQDWRPYCDRGRWINTDCGYYWQSDYSWGWAPFHYGRWFHHPGRGWCWRPDSVWAPAWVSWRYTDTHCGWAPLPPGARFHEGGGFTYYGAHVGVNFNFGLHRDAWTFVAAERFHDREVWRHAVPAREHLQLYRQSTVVNNYVVHNHTVINRGVPADRVHGLAQTEVRKVTVRDLPARNAGTVRPDRLHQEGSELVVYRPKPPVVGESHGTRAPESLPAARATVYQGPGGVKPSSGLTTNPQHGTSPAAPGVRPGTEVPSAAPSSRPNRAVVAPATAPSTSPNNSSELVARTRPQPATTPAPSSPTAGVPQASSRVEPRPAPALPGAAAPRGTAPQVQPAAPSVSPDAMRTIPTTRPAPARVAPPQTATPQIYRPTTTPSPTVRPERPNSAAQAPQVVPVPNPAIRPTVDPNRGLSGATSPAMQRPVSAAPEPAPTQVYRQENSRPAPTIAPERPTPSAPAYQPSRVEVPAYRSGSVPTYSAPAQPSYSPPQVSRPAPSYSPPAVQSRPAPSAPAYTPPPSRPAPQAAPAPSQPDRSNNRRQN